MNELPDTVEFDVYLEDGTRVGSMLAQAIPVPGDEIRIDEPGKQPIYEVVRRFFEPSNTTIYVRPVGSGSEQAQSPFAKQPPGASGFT